MLSPIKLSSILHEDLLKLQHYNKVAKNVFKSLSQYWKLEFIQGSFTHSSFFLSFCYFIYYIFRGKKTCQELQIFQYLSQMPFKIDMQNNTSDIIELQSQGGTPRRIGKARWGSWKYYFFLSCRCLALNSGNILMLYVLLRTGSIFLINISQVVTL